MRVWTRIAVSTIGAGFALSMAGAPALAGEVSGNGKDLPLRGASICKFSGQNDEPDDPIEGGRVQSYGQIVRQLGPPATLAELGIPSPGLACNPNNGAGE